MNIDKHNARDTLFSMIYHMRSEEIPFNKIRKNGNVQVLLNELGHGNFSALQLKSYYIKHEKRASNITRHEVVFEPSVVSSEHKKSSIVRLTGDEEEQLQRILQSALKGAMMQPLLHTSIVIWTELVITERINRKSGENHDQTTK